MSKRIVACMGRQVGKTTTIAWKAVHHAYTNPNKLTLIVSPSLRQSMIMFERILSLINSNGLLRSSVVRQTRTVIQLTNGSQIIALPCSENLLRGYAAHMVIVDEAAFLEDYVISQVLFPMLAATNGTLILLSTPWGKNNFFYQAFMNPEYSVYHVPSSANPLISKAFLDEQRLNMTEDAFRMEYEAEFVETTGSYFQMDLIRRCVNPELELARDVEVWNPEPGEHYLGCDLGKMRDYSVIAAVRKVDEAHLQLVFLQEFPLHTSYTEVVGSIVRLNRKANIVYGLIDRSGPGEVVLDEIGEQGLTNVEAASFSREKKAEYLAFLKLKMEKGEFKMPYDRRLCEQINEQRYEYTKSGGIRFWHPDRSHDDQLWALALAVYATKGKRENGVVMF